MPFGPFFSPSSDLTNQLLIHMGQRRARVLREAAANDEEIEGETPESEELVDALLAALEDEPEHKADQDWEDQRWLGDIMYHLLGRLAGRAQRQGLKRVATTDKTIIEGMSTSLGLYEARDMPLLAEFAGEFSSWLSDQPGRSYPAGWGRIVSEPYRTDVFYLEPFDRDAPTTATQTDAGDAEWGISVGVGTGAGPNAVAQLAEADFDT